MLPVLLDQAVPLIAQRIALSDFGVMLQNARRAPGELLQS